MKRYTVGQFDESQLATPAHYHEHCAGYTRTELIDHASAPSSVHMGLAVVNIEAGGYMNPVTQAFEKGFYVLQGTVIATIGEQSLQLSKDHYSLVPYGTSHAWHNAGSETVRLLEMMTPQPKATQDSFRDTFFHGGMTAPTSGDAPVLNANTLPGYFDERLVERDEDLSSIGASSGVTMIEFIDRAFGAVHQRMFLLQYLPGAAIKIHDHTFEEAYFVTSGEVEAVLEGEVYTVKAGGIIWTGVGCMHSFSNVSDQPVRWIETQAPLPPSDQVFRFQTEWAERGAEIES